MDDLLREFLTESAEHLDRLDADLVRFEREPGNRAILHNIFRLVHTIKGTCGFLGLPRLEALAHAAETVMGSLRYGSPASAEAVALILATMDRLEAVLIGLEASGTEPDQPDGDLIAALEHLARRNAEAMAPIPEPAPQHAFEDAPGPHGSEPVAPAGPARPPSTAAGPRPIRDPRPEIARRREDAGDRAARQCLSHVTGGLQDGRVKPRMQPIGTGWRKLPRLLRALSVDLGKGIDLVIQGAETELDRHVLDLIRDPLTHMVRNAADHGIEGAAERRLAGKPPRGTIRLSAYREGSTIGIEIADDGRGLDLRAIRRKAVERGIAAQAAVERMSDAQAARFIFHAGLSTATAVTTVSGRGVGMDVVRTNVEALGGLIDIATKAGAGTTFIIRVPLAPAIVSARIVDPNGAGSGPSAAPRPANAA